jgi:predicted metal-binding membrane protein
MLWRYRQTAAASSEMRPHRLTALVGVGYFFMWTLIGAVVFPIGLALATVQMQHPAIARAAPLAGAVVVLLAGCLQFTRWKLRHLACCRASAVCNRSVPDDEASAWRYGMRLGLHCAQCCAGLIAILLAVGVMDPTAMAIVAVAITVERISSAGERVARIIGAIIVATGSLMIAITLLPALRG